MKLDYRSTQAGFQAELKRLARVRERLTNMLVRVDERIKAVSVASEALDSVLQAESRPEIPLAAITDKGEDFEITATIREFLKSAFTCSYHGTIEMQQFSAPQIRDHLVSKGWKADEYDNPLAVIHTVLKRLVKTGDVERTEDRRFYLGVLSESEQKAIVEKEEDENARRSKEFRENKERDKARIAQRQANAKKIERVCREIFLVKRAVMSIEEFRELLVQRGIDLSFHATPWSGILNRFGWLGIKKRPDGLWAYEAPATAEGSQRAESAN